MWEKLVEISMKFFKGSLDPYVPYFETIRQDLTKSGIPLSLKEYVYGMIFITLVTFLVSLPLFTLISSGFMHPVLSFLFSLTISFIISLLVFFIFYSYPSFVVSRKKKEIESVLPFATTYMATISSSGAPPTLMFKILSQFDEYGEVSNEAKRICRDMDLFGVDLLEAMRRAAARTPSPLFKELLWGMTTVISSGSDLSVYLREKANGFMQERRRRLQEYSKTLALLIEIYLTLIIVGSIFFIIMTAIMSSFSMGGVSDGTVISFFQFLIIYVILPVVSAGFIHLLKALAPR
ncbi:MAG: hypothetical protein GXO63_03070 [Candidatus Micrarchaeota archaeon]|nr:hypothetical protein [Candidatus Micrarchaeota archaeon]